MSSQNALKKFWRNKKARDISILAVVVIVLLVTLSINLKKPPPKESERVMICDKCKYTGVMKFTDIKKVVCPKCGKGRMHFAMKCVDCQYEFPYPDIEIPPNMTVKEKRRLLEKELKCPNCGSHNVFPISVYMWKKQGH